MDDKPDTAFPVESASRVLPTLGKSVDNAAVFIGENVVGGVAGAIVYAVSRTLAFGMERTEALLPVTASLPLEVLSGLLAWGGAVVAIATWLVYTGASLYRFTIGPRSGR